MKAIARTVLVTTLATVLGAGVFWRGTDGFTAFTAEAARRADILRSPRALPATVLEDQDGRVFSLDDYRGRLLAVEFIYTRCTTICRSLGVAFKQLRDRLPPDALGRDVALLSISFDPARDDPPSLKAYGRSHGADGEHWRIARVSDTAQLEALLAAFGIVVIADKFGEFEHNAAIHLVGRDGRLAEIADLDAPDRFADRLREAL
ncbi:SCO family protein [Aromatoleum toluclasticum]|uniref:SCO family protein n=1 Tax=Aromatoleum toluclasticum TaxID=92003 RepID=UPI001D18CF87|nr:SCO family protein [Aromatoleum toluclasticum]MCC4115391.1 SCO family protein [Aromatoleum toluclasticum]